MSVHFEVQYKLRAFLHEVDGHTFKKKKTYEIYDNKYDKFVCLFGIFFLNATFSYFRYIITASFIDEGSQRTKRESRTCQLRSGSNEPGH